MMDNYLVVDGIKDPDTYELEFKGERWLIEDGALYKYVDCDSLEGFVKVAIFTSERAEEEFTRLIKGMTIRIWEEAEDCKAWREDSQEKEFELNRYKLIAWANGVNAKKGE